MEEDDFIFDRTIFSATYELRLKKEMSTEEKDFIIDTDYILCDVRAEAKETVDRGENRFYI